MTNHTFLGTNLAPGHCIIVNQCDRPAAHLVAVVVVANSEMITARYLCTRTSIDMVMAIDTARATPLAAFGVTCRQYTARPGCYVVTPTGAPATATYPNGTRRYWQDDNNNGVPMPARPDVLALAVAAAEAEAVTP